MLVYVLPFQEASFGSSSLVAEITQRLAGNGHAAIFGDHLEDGGIVEQVVSRCDAILDPEGQRIYADPLFEGVPFYTWPEIPPVDPIERDYPQQTTQFRRVLSKMYRQHLAKCADYSPSNILVTGEMGVLVRVSDKIMRLLTLAGFKVKIEEPSKFDAPLQAKNESTEDSWGDLANYGVINLLLRSGHWGR